MSSRPLDAPPPSACAQAEDPPPRPALLRDHRSTPPSPTPCPADPASDDVAYVRVCRRLSALLVEASEALASPLPDGPVDTPTDGPMDAFDDDPMDISDDMLIVLDLPPAVPPAPTKRPFEEMRQELIELAHSIPPPPPDTSFTPSPRMRAAARRIDRCWSRMSIATTLVGDTPEDWTSFPMKPPPPAPDQEDVLLEVSDAVSRLSTDVSHLCSLLYRFLLSAASTSPRTPASPVRALPPPSSPEWQTEEMSQSIVEHLSMNHGIF